MLRLGVGLALTTVALALAGASAGDTLPKYGSATVVGQVPTAGGFVNQIAVADLNGDGLQDAIVTRSVYLGTQTFPVTVLVNDGHGEFVDQTSAIFSGPVPSTQNARELVVADFNGDQRPDVFIADHGDDRDPFAGFPNTLILSAPGGKLVDASANIPRDSDFTHSAAAGDVNGDGTVDLYVGNIWGSNRVPPRILLNDGTGHFRVGDGLLPSSQTDLDMNRYTSSLFVDVNGDGKLDLVLGADDHTASSVVLVNDGTGHFSVLPNALSAKPFGPNAITLDIASADLNGDGRPDLLTATTKGNPFYVGRWIQVLVNNGNGTFHDETASRLPQVDTGDAWPIFLDVRDIDHDGRVDIGEKIGGNGGSAPLLFLADAQGAFHSASPPDVGGNYLWAFIDAEGDGGTDFLAVNPGSGTVSLTRELPKATIPDAPQGVTATRNDPTGIRVTWLAVAGATSYEVTRNGKSIGTTAAPTFFDQPASGRSYFYRVRAISELGPGPFSRWARGVRARG